jgi:glutaminyl-tRNA synthetase
VSKANSVVAIELFETIIRDTLNRSAERRMAVLRPLELVLENLPGDAEEELNAPNHPENPDFGNRTIRLRRRLFIERRDFCENPPKGFDRLAPGRETRLRYAFVVKCVGVEKDASGEVTKVICHYDPATRGGDTPDGRKVKGTLHWVDAATSVEAEIRLVDRLFLPARPSPSDLREQINPSSLEIIRGCRVEPSVASWPSGKPLQFERQGYFTLDPDSGESGLVFNRTIGLRETWRHKDGCTQAEAPWRSRGPLPDSINLT